MKNGTCEFFRIYASRLKGLADLVVIGHVHRAVDEPRTGPRMIVLGGWQARSSFLKVDEKGASFHVEHDQNRPGASGRRPSAGDGRAHEARLHED